MKLMKLRNLRKTTILRLSIIFASTTLLLLIAVGVLIACVVRDGGETELPAPDTGTEAPESDSEAELESLRAELEAVKKERDQLSGELEAQQSAGNADAAELVRQVSEKDARISVLENQIDLLEGGYAGDTKRQAKLFSALADLIASPPQIEYEEEIEAEVGGEKGTVTVTKTRMPKLSLCYLDLTTGYTFSFSGDTEFDSASVVKAPYALSVLRAASKEQAERKEKIASGVSEELLAKPTYDLTDSIIYTKDEYFKEGSGEIAQGEEGKEYTYAELFTYLLSVSDNVAYGVLTDSYGHTLLRELVRENDWSSMTTTTRNMSARDGCEIMKAIYEFTESGAEYSSLMKDALLGSAERRLIMSVADGREVAHKYGWDVGAFHDIGIVYDEHPYAVAIFSDYDEATGEQVLYMQSLLSAVDDLHRAYYEESGN